jgi:hypothetical protein
MHFDDSYLGGSGRTVVHPLPGIAGSVRIDTAITLPLGVEAYALRAWLATSSVLSARTRRFAFWSAIGSFLLGMAGQVAYHLLAQSGRSGHRGRSPPLRVGCDRGL